MTAWLAAVLVVLGAALMLVGSLGVVRMPDTITRLHAATKAGAVGLSLLMLAVAVELPGSSGLEATLVVAFVLLTAPVAAHTIARAAYYTGVQLWEGTWRDDLRESGDVERILARDVRAIRREDWEAEEEAAEERAEAEARRDRR
jgi:multicomponent Na+:H+ antiporter subunit G